MNKENYNASVNRFEIENQDILEILIKPKAGSLKSLMK